MSGETHKLELSRTYHRYLLEALAIASQPDMKPMNLSVLHLSDSKSGSELRATDMQSIIGIIHLAVSVPASTSCVYPDVELVAELPEHDPLHTPSTQFSVVQVR
jgi:hypothetical protein